MNRKLTTLAVVATLTLPFTGSAYSQETAAKKEVYRVSSPFTRHQPRKIAKAAKVKDAPAADWAGRKFMGGLISADSWMDLSITDVPYGVYEFTIGDNAIKNEPKYTAMVNDWMAASRARDKFYGVRAVTMFGTLANVAYNEIDLDTFTELRSCFSVTGNENASFSDLSSVMCYDPTDDTVYSLNYNEDLTGLQWAKFNTADMTFDIISQFNGRFNVLAMAATPDGSIYCVSSDGDLYTINKSNGRVSLVGATGVFPAMYSQSMAYDGRTGKFLWAALTSTDVALYAIDPETAETERIKRFTDMEQIVGLYFDKSEGRPEAPAAMTDLKMEYSAAGSTEGFISFTIPSLSGNGSALGNDVTVTVTLDGEKLIDNQDVSAGQKMNVPFSLEQGNHYVAVVTSNGAGFGPVNSLYRYAGYDYPTAVTDLTFTQTDGTATVTWTAPAEGQNGGYLDPDRMYYQVWRMPENVLAADNLKTTSFSETLPDEIRHYYYKVIPFNGSDRKGEEAVSETQLYGKSFAVPYSRTFDAPSSDDDYTIFDLDGDGSSWAMSDWNPEMDVNITYDQNVDANNDWLISPNISLEKGKVYRLTMNMRNPFSSYPETFVAAFATEINPGSVDNFTVFNEWNDWTADDFTDVDACFSVPESGDYYIAIGYLSKRDVGSMLRVKDQRIDLVGNVGAPAAVKNLAITSQPDETAEALISFTAPSLDMAGESLPGSMNVNIFRDGVKIHTIENVAPSTAAEWIDTESTVGYHNYTVTPANGEGDGMPVTMRCFVGVYTTPFTLACDSKAAMENLTLVTEGFDQESATLSFSEYDSAVTLNHYNMSEDTHDMWVVLPAVRLNDESVYEFTCDYRNGGYDNAACHYAVVMGDKPKAASLTTEVGELPESTSYAFVPVSHEVIVKEGGNKHLSFYTSSRKVNDYTSIAYRNIGIVYKASAKSPYSVADLTATPDAGGALKITLAFEAPKTDYAGRDIRSISRIDIYRGENSAIPAYTFTDVTPGDKLQWTDEQPLAGNNTYLVVPSNESGRGRHASITAYAGFDTPTAVLDYAIRPSADNQHPVLSWAAPAAGVNGGVLDYDHLTYAVAAVYPDAAEESEQIKMLAQGITSTSYEYARPATDNQELCYYAVLPVTPQGVGAATIYYTILGKPYAVPFAESFGNGEPSTGLWLSLSGQGGPLQCGPTYEIGMGDYGAAPQDNDHGAFFFLNGNYSDYRGTISIATPKFDVNGASKPVLSFYLYKGNQSGIYGQAPEMRISASNDETEFTLLDRIEWNEETPGWIKYEYPLDSFTDKEGALFFLIEVDASGMNDIVFMDNFRIDAESGIGTISPDGDVAVYGVNGGILTHGAAGQTVTVTSIKGEIVATFTADDTLFSVPQGLYIVTIGNKSCKVVVK